MEKSFKNIFKNLFKKTDRIRPEATEENIMAAWAERECRIACKRENPNYDFDSDEVDYGCACYKSALKAYKSLAEDGHSGMSFNFTRDILTRLMNDMPLTPITERLMKALLWFLGAFPYETNTANGVTIGELIAWLEEVVKPNLNSMLKSTTWKPTEEEMSAIYRMVYIDGCDDEFEKPLRHLYQDLKREFFDGASIENMPWNYQPEPATEKKEDPDPIPKKVHNDLDMLTCCRIAVETYKATLSKKGQACSNYFNFDNKIISPAVVLDWLDNLRLHYLEPKQWRPTEEQYNAEQKPAEWSEEDIRTIDRACVALRAYSNGDLPNFLPSELLGYADRLQTLKPQSNGRNDR